MSAMINLFVFCSVVVVTSAFVPSFPSGRPMRTSFRHVTILPEKPTEPTEPTTTPVAEKEDEEIVDKTPELTKVDYDPETSAEKIPEVFEIEIDDPELVAVEVELPQEMKENTQYLLDRLEEEDPRLQVETERQASVRRAKRQRPFFRYMNDNMDGYIIKSTYVPESINDRDRDSIRHPVHSAKHLSHVNVTKYGAKIPKTGSSHSRGRVEREIVQHWPKSVGYSKRFRAAVHDRF